MNEIIIFIYSLKFSCACCIYYDNILCVCVCVCVSVYKTPKNYEYTYFCIK